MNTKLVIFIVIGAMIITAGVYFSVLSQNKSQKNDQIGISANISVEKTTPPSGGKTTPAFTPKKLNITLSESVNMATR